MALTSDLMMKKSKVLHAAADLLEKGWCQGALGQREHRIMEHGLVRVTRDFVRLRDFRVGAEIDQLCLMGGLMKAVMDLYGEDWPNVLYENQTALQRAMVMSYLQAGQAVSRVATGLSPVTISTWNDDRKRTQADVVDVVRRAAVSEEEAGR